MLTRLKGTIDNINDPMVQSEPDQHTTNVNSPVLTPYCTNIRQRAALNRRATCAVRRKPSTSISKICDCQIVREHIGVFSSTRVDNSGNGKDPIALAIKRAKRSVLIGFSIWLHLRQRIAFDEKSNLECPIVAPKADTMFAFIVTTTGIRKA